MESSTRNQHRFANIPKADIQRSVFNRSCGLKTTFDSGYLIPIFADEALPGDTMSLKMHNFTRMSTPEFPFMDNLFLDTFFFAVPMRLLWDNWAKFNGEQDSPGDSTDYLVPQMSADTEIGHPEGSIADYLGIPTNVPALTHSAMWHRAYQLIYKEWFRDENIQGSLPILKDDGPDSPFSYILFRRGKRHDYFTSALPFPQKGESVLLPLGDTAPVVPMSGAPSWVMQNSLTSHNLESGPSGSKSSATWTGSDPGLADDRAYWDEPNLEVDLSDATAATINQLRQAFQVQRLFERDARGGTRYTEIVRSHFGVTSPDQRLQRPEYLGGGSQNIMVTPVSQTAGTEDPVGTLGAYAISQGSNHSFVKSFSEHCIILGLASVRGDLNYQQGLNRMFSRKTRFDFYWPALAHIGEQAILNKEIYAQGSIDPDEDEEVFGYQERWAEYRYKPSQITGKFRSNYAQSLDNWHLAQDFATLPTLTNTWITEKPPVERVVAVPSEPEFLFDAYFDFKHTRPMPTYSVPGMIDHF